jgi:predicted transcriptional regulator
VKKTSIYLTEDDVQRLLRLAQAEGKSQAEIIRDAIASYEAGRRANRNFAISGAWAGDGTSIADVPDDELMKGFGS